MKTKKCPQMKCGYNIQGGCKNCELCDCPPNEINESCDRCWNCANDEGILRWDNKTIGNELSQAEMKKLFDKIMKLQAKEVKPIEEKVLEVKPNYCG